MIARACAVPGDGLLQTYVGQGDSYTDCFEVMSPHSISLSDFIDAFYTTWLFRLERAVLTLALRRRITDASVTALAEGGDRFAVWQVEARRENEILLADKSGNTRSYLAVSPKEGGVTRLVFGSAVVVPEGQQRGMLLRALIPLHRIYSKLLLRLAERRLRFS